MLVDVRRPGRALRGHGGRTRPGSSGTWRAGACSSTTQACCRSTRRSSSGSSRPASCGCCSRRRPSRWASTCRRARCASTRSASSTASAFRPLLARQYWQMAGRAGRQGIDDRGYVFSLLDETDIDYQTIEYLQSGRTENVRSRFNLNYSAILNLYARVGDRVVEAWARSFARFQERPGPQGKPPRPQAQPQASDPDGGRERAAAAARVSSAPRLEPCSASSTIVQRAARSPARGRYARARQRLRDRRDRGLRRRLGVSLRPGAGRHAVRLDRLRGATEADASVRPTRSLKGIAIPFQARMAEVAVLEEERGDPDADARPGLRHRRSGPALGGRGVGGRAARRDDPRGR